MITVENIRQAFPEPISYKDAQLHAPYYCVGGAFAMYVKDKTPDNLSEGERFPMNEQLLQLAIVINPTIEPTLALALIDEMTEHNDKGEFELAWLCLDQLLRIREY